MTSRLFSGIAAALVFVPLTVLAAFSRPSDAIRAIHLLEKPMDFQIEAHGKYEHTYASLWVRGYAEHAKMLSKMRARMDITFDIAAGGERARVKTQVRIVDGTAYVMLERLDGMYGGEFLARETSEMLGKWHSIPLSEERDRALQEVGISEEEAQDMAWRVIDAVLSLERQPGNDDVLYSLTLHRSAWKNIVTLAEEFAEEKGDVIPRPSRRDLAELRKILRTTNIHINIRTNDDDVVESAKSYFHVAIDEAWATFLGGFSIRTTPVIVRVPPNATPL